MPPLKHKRSNSEPFTPVSMLKELDESVISTITHRRTSSASVATDSMRATASQEEEINVTSIDLHEEQELAISEESDVSDVSNVNIKNIEKILESARQLKIDIEKESAEPQSEVSSGKTEEEKKIELAKQRIDFEKEMKRLSTALLVEKNSLDPVEYKRFMTTRKELIFENSFRVKNKLEIARLELEKIQPDFDPEQIKMMTRERLRLLAVQELTQDTGVIIGNGSNNSFKFSDLKDSDCKLSIVVIHDASDEKACEIRIRKDNSNGTSADFFFKAIQSPDNKTFNFEKIDTVAPIPQALLDTGRTLTLTNIKEETEKLSDNINTKSINLDKRLEVLANLKRTSYDITLDNETSKSKNISTANDLEANFDNGIDKIKILQDNKIYKNKTEYMNLLNGISVDPALPPNSPPPLTLDNSRTANVATNPVAPNTPALQGSTLPPKPQR